MWTSLYLQLHLLNVLIVFVKQIVIAEGYIDTQPSAAQNEPINELK